MIAAILQKTGDLHALRIFYFKIDAVIVVIAYLLGSIPFGYLVGRARGIDIRKHGSGNIGATNVLRTLGKPAGIFVFICDAAKGLAAVLIGKHFAASHGFEMVNPGAPLELYFEFLPPAVAAISAGVACILGHNFPVWLKFKGGKGIATSAGVLLGMMWQAVLVCLIVWAAVFYATGYVSLASILAAISLPVVVLVLLCFTSLLTGWPLFYFAVVVAVLAVWRHRANIGRLLAGTESRFGGAAKKSEHEFPPHE